MSDNESKGRRSAASHDEPKNKHKDSKEKEHHAIGRLSLADVIPHAPRASHADPHARPSLADTLKPGETRGMTYYDSRGSHYPGHFAAPRRSLRKSMARVLHLPSPAPTPVPTPTPSQELREAAAERKRIKAMMRRHAEAERMAKCHITRCLPPRCIFAVLAHTGFSIIYGLQLNLSIAIVAMVVESSSKGAPSECPPSADLKAGGIDAGTKYDWDGSVRGILLSAYYYGYIVSQIPGAVLADMFSAKWVMWSAVLCTVIGCAITPLVCTVHWGLYTAVRVMQGAGAGVTFPAMHIMISTWAPPAARSVFTGIVYAGTASGMIASTVVSGFLTAAVTWEWMFYISALMCIPWLICWACWIEDSPMAPVYIICREGEEAAEEYEHEQELHPTKKKRLRFPCKDVAKSSAFWAILVAHVGGNTGLYCFMTQVPTYMQDVLRQDLKSNTTFSMIPFIVMFVTSNIGGPPLDAMRNKKMITTAQARKIGATLALVIPAASLIGLTFNDCSLTITVVCLTISVGFIGFQSVAWLGNHIDIAPNFAGLLMGITNTMATIPGILVPVLMGMLTANDNTMETWNKGFYTIAAIMLVCYVVFVSCAKGEVQYWNNPQPDPSDHPEKKEKEPGGPDAPEGTDKKGAGAAPHK